MFIRKIELNNYRIYQGAHSLTFEKDSQRNIYIISGNNGYGKTSLLTALIWCLYGKNMQEVDDSFKRQILDLGGYRKYILSCLNYAAAEKAETPLSVSINFSDISVPGFSCNEITVRRTYITDREHEELEILIDGKANELVQEIGKEIFIHDFILPKEIAKFFFFDAERNVALAEMKSVNDRLNLSKAYSEILGIRKYEDLKTHLSDLRIRYRKSSANHGDTDKLNRLESEIDQLHKLVLEKQEKLGELAEEKMELKAKSDRLQEKLIREGSGINLDQVKGLQQARTKLQKEYEHLRQQFGELMDLAPFAIAGSLMLDLEKQLKIEAENAARELPAEVVNKKVKNLLMDLKKVKSTGGVLDKRTRAFMADAIEELLGKHFVQPAKKIRAASGLHFTTEEHGHFTGIMQQLRTSFRNGLFEINRRIRNNRIEYNRINKQLTEAESKETDQLIQAYRHDKAEMDNKLTDIEALIIEENKQQSVAEHQFASKKKVMEELAKKVQIEARYKEKDDLAAKLVVELDEFLLRIKNEKRKALELRIQKSLNSLMHKVNFVTKVKVEMENEMLDIHLYNRKTEIIKDNLSKGEQQIYATALLKALVEESNIDFPVFVDSPMHKYDIEHSSRIITEFYPAISKQVILFPLLNKELSKAEYALLNPYIRETYLIKNTPELGSFFLKVQPDQLFNPSIVAKDYAL